MKQSGKNADSKWKNSVSKNIKRIFAFNHFEVHSRPNKHCLYRCLYDS